jgi:hypothetical protein
MKEGTQRVGIYVPRVAATTTALRPMQQSSRAGGFSTRYIAVLLGPRQGYSRINENANKLLYVKGAGSQ